MITIRHFSSLFCLQSLVYLLSLVEIRTFHMLFITRLNCHYSSCLKQRSEAVSAFFDIRAVYITSVRIAFRGVLFSRLLIQNECTMADITVINRVSLEYSALPYIRFISLQYRFANTPMYVANYLSRNDTDPFFPVFEAIYAIEVVIPNELNGCVDFSFSLLSQPLSLV